MSAVIQGLFLLTAIVLPEFTCLGCLPGWFGDRCQYKCHCAKSVACGSSGECQGMANCAPGYFGVGCQYVDLAFLYALPNNSRFLYDQDDHSCNPDTRASSVSIQLKDSFPASWFRITVRDYSNLLMFTLAINKYYPCENEIRHVVSSFIVDVVCENGFMLREVTIKGLIAPTVCSLYISGGRNIALKQFVNQSTTYYRKGDASHAVDGNTNRNFEMDSCARTNSGRQQKFTMYFDQPTRLLRALLYNSELTPGTNQLRGFELYIYDSRDALVRRHTDAYRASQPVYDISLVSSEPIVKLQILGTNDYPQRSNALYFCEIEVYGDYWCPDKHYGLDCSKKCTCSYYDACNEITGVCTPTCATGRYGHDCTRQCSSNCAERKCESQSGVCYSCTSGTTGEFCASANKGTPDSGASSYLWSLVPVVMVMLTLPLIIYVCVEKNRSDTQTAQPAAVTEETQPQPP